MRHLLLITLALSLLAHSHSIACLPFAAEASQVWVEAADSQDEQIDTDSDEESDTDAEKDADAEQEEEIELTLERLFPEKSVFGPSAHSTAFSHDGRYAAYLYRPYIERRHGNDIWLYDTQTGETTRLTSVSVMDEFQEATRKVREDRVKKAKKAGHGKKKTEEKQEQQEEQSTGTQQEQVTLLEDVSGTWEGLLSGGGEELGIPPAGLPFVFHLEIRSDGSVAGTLVTTLATITITAGRYDLDSKPLECTLAAPESGMQGVLVAGLADGEMTGSITIAEMDLKLELTAKRTGAAAGDASRGAADDDEQDDDTRQDEEEDADDAEEGGDAEKQDGEEEQDDKEDDRDLGEIVLEDDADDDRAPRYGGVNDFVWAPHAHEMIITSAGDLYRYDLESETLTRLTRTQDGERDVQYLPDGSGYTYRSGSALMKITFGSSLIEQIDPQIPGGESMDGYRVSPDGTRLAFRTSKGGDWWSAGEQINIVNYRDRFAQVRQVPRHMPDDPLPDVTESIYLYDLTEHFTEKSEPQKVFSKTRTGTRDMLNVPQWSPNSDAIAFASYEQETDLVRILEARWERDAAPEEADGAASEQDAGEAAGDEDAEEESGDQADEEEDEQASADAADSKNERQAPKPEEARIVYRFLHNGGPNTPGMIEPEYLADGRRLVFVAEISGFRQLHTLDPTYEQLDQLTRGRFEIYPLRMSKDRSTIFVTSTKNDPAQRNIYAVDLESGVMTRLDETDGAYSTVAVSDDGKHVLANHVDFGSPTDLVAIDVEAEDTKQLTDSHTEEAHILTSFMPEYFTFENRHGQEIHGRMFKPDDWTPDDKRPLLIYVYGGPLGTSKMITRGSFSGESYFFHYYMTKVHGYITCTIDPRGASGFGGLFEKSNYEQVGKPQVEDLVDGAKWMIENHGVDKDRIGVHGWSFGGFQTQMCLYTEPDFFAAGIAGAGPTEWHNYNTWYSTGTIGPSREGKTDLEEFSLLPLAKNLKARLLLVHGMEDSNVLYQDTVRVYRELLQAGKETLVELFLDPTGGHGLGGDVKTINRMRKYEEFFLRVLGTGQSAQAEQADTDEAQQDDAESQEDATEEGDEVSRGVFWL